MKFPAYLHIEGTEQGMITQGVSTSNSVGNKWQEDHQDEILIQGLSHGMATTGNGLRKHEALVILKEADKSSPLLRQALVRGETLTECVLRLYRINALGTLENYFTITLHDAIISDLQIEAPKITEEPQEEELPWLLEKVSFSYRKIDFRHEISNTLMTDYWEDSSSQPQSNTATV